MSVLDDYLVDPRLSLLDKTRIQAQSWCQCCGTALRAGKERRTQSSTSLARLVEAVVRRRGR